MRGRTSAVFNCRGKTKRGRTRGRDLNHTQLPMAAPFKPQRPQKQGLGTSPAAHTSLLHRCAGESLQTLCQGHNVASSYSSQSMDTQSRDHLHVERQGEAWEDVPVGAYSRAQNGDTGKEQQKAVSELLQGGTQGSMPSPPSAASKGCAKLSEMFQDFGISQEIQPLW